MYQREKKLHQEVRLFRLGAPRVRLSQFTLAAVESSTKRLPDRLIEYMFAGQLWQADSDEPDAPVVFYVDGHRKAVYSYVLVPRGPVGKYGGKILGCRELVVLHDAQGHPLLATIHRGDHHLRIGLPQMLHCYEQATGQALMQRVVAQSF